MHNVLSLILGGGRGTRLHPLTRERSKPAVPLAGKYRLIDIPISNCLNSGVDRIFVLTQFLAQSLNHHVSMTYRFDNFRRQGFVSILAAEQTGIEQEDWYQGTADAVRKVLRHTERYRFNEYLILSGDHIYRMDYREMIREHRARGADVTVAALEVPREKVPALGVMEINDDGRIERFVEKPQDPEVIDTLEISPAYFKNRGEEVQEGMYLGNMGVYVFNREAMHKLLHESPAEDFGRQILPYAIEHGLNVYAHRFGGYWEDIGTIKAFFEANLAFTDPVPSFSFFDEINRIFTHGRYLPPNKINGARLERVFLADGCILDRTEIEHAVVGIRSRIAENTTIRSSVIMGSDGYETVEERLENDRIGRPHAGIGPGSRIERCIVDKNARVGANVRLIGGDREDVFEDQWTLRDGILVVHKDAVIPDGTTLDFG